MYRVYVLLLLLAASPVPAEEIYSDFWNVENLFDTVDDPAVEGDEEFTPSGGEQVGFARLKRLFA